MDVHELIRRRRTIKAAELRTDEVDEGLIRELLEAAHWAPSHGKTFPWRFVIFRGEGRRALRDVMARITCSPDEPSDDDVRVKKLDATLLRVPVVIALVCSPHPKQIEHEEIASVAMAVENMHLLATARGLGLAWSSGKKVFDDRLRSFLGFAEPARCLGLLYVGWPSGDWPTGSRPPIDAFIEWRS